MDINKLILTVKKKIKENIILENIQVEDKTFLHKKHQTHQLGKFHLKLIIQSLFGLIKLYLIKINFN